MREKPRIRWNQEKRLWQCSFWDGLYIDEFGVYHAVEGFGNGDNLQEAYKEACSTARNKKAAIRGAYRRVK